MTGGGRPKGPRVYPEQMGNQGAIEVADHVASLGEEAPDFMATLGEVEGLPEGYVWLEEVAREAKKTMKEALRIAGQARRQSELREVAGRAAVKVEWVEALRGS